MNLPIYETEEQASETIIIKKYANRRLYNTMTSCYVTLEDVGKMVREGLDFVVYDAKTGEDITRSILTQIIFEEEGRQGKSALLPVSFLRDLIRFYGDSLHNIVPGYLDISMTILKKNQKRFQDTVTGVIDGAAFPLETFEQITRQQKEFLEKSWSLFNPFHRSSPTDTSEDLQDRIQKLEYENQRLRGVITSLEKQ